jgi:hypothetical protein
MRRTRAPESIEAGNGTVEYVEADDEQLLRLAGPYNEPLRIQHTADVLSVMAMLVDYMRTASEPDSDDEGTNC